MAVVAIPAGTSSHYTRPWALSLEFRPRDAMRSGLPSALAQW